MTPPISSRAASSGHPPATFLGGPSATGYTTTRRIFLLTGAGISLLLAILLLAGGTTGLWQLTKRDSSGFFTSNTTTLSTDSYAITSDTLDIGPEAPRLFGDRLGTLQMRVSSNKPVFIGIARTSDVQRYLARVNHQAVTTFGLDPFSVTYTDRPGTGQPEPPAVQSFWRSETTGIGTQTIRWPLQKGNWTAVVMNADGSRHVVVDASVGARIPALRWVVVGVLLAGVILLLISVGLVWSGFGFSSARRR